ncbi:hypothetical protein K2173_004100 [Erythroxylum novogranatense]|uniref:Methyltransferase-like protein 13 n=1 Tax=Erythroxylum novogranatense TaxID=1862640 RepID=A0AAV8SY91_9ROSI|nr:hypothetical protein K2173_004100 [Erythroxylum novogranatense]
MNVDRQKFQEILPGRYVTFTVSVPTPENSDGKEFRFAVLDSPAGRSLDENRQVAAIVVPKGMESDWNFCTKKGHIEQLSGHSRVIMIGENPQDDSPLLCFTFDKEEYNQYRKDIGRSLQPFLVDLVPRIIDRNLITAVPILEMDTRIDSIIGLERFFGKHVGEMIVEDVALQDNSGGGSSSSSTSSSSNGVQVCSRALRFKRMPNLHQTIVLIGKESLKIGEREVPKPDLGVLLAGYHIAMIASLSMINEEIMLRINEGLKPRALCLGVGGGALLSFLKTQLGFEVHGVEIDEVVLQAARKYFDLEDSDDMKIRVANALEFVDKLDRDGDQYCPREFEVIMVDIDTCDPVRAPPKEFFARETLLTCKYLLRDFGMLVMNVISQGKSSGPYRAMLRQLRSVFYGIYEMDIDNASQHDVILIASASDLEPASDDSQNPFLMKLRETTGGRYSYSIRKVNRR